MSQNTQKTFGIPEQAGALVHPIPQGATRVAMIMAIITLLLVAILHILKPDQDPSWHLASEYAIGDFGWLMQVSFFCWALSCLLLATILRREVSTTGGHIGIVLLFLVGIAIIMAGIFVIDSPATPKEQLTTHGHLHGLASMIGVPGQPIAALLISKSLVRKLPWSGEKRIILRTAHFTWISLLLMFASLALMMITNNGQFGPGAVIGWTNRIYILACCIWLITIARLSYKFGNNIPPGRSVYI